MGRNIARFHLPVEGSIRQEVQQLATRHVVLSIHQIEIAMDRVHDDAVRQSS